LLERKFRFDPSKPRWNEIAKLLAQVAGLFSGIALVLVSRSRDAFGVLDRDVRDRQMGTQRRYKRTSAPSDRKHMSYYVDARVWPCSRDVCEVTAPRDVFDYIERRPPRNGTFRASSSIP